MLGKTILGLAILAFVHLADATTYVVKIHTSDKWWAGTDSGVFCQIIGSRGRTSELELDNPGNDMERGDTDTYTFTDNDIGQFSCIKLRLDGSDGWTFDTVDVAINGKWQPRINNPYGEFDDDRQEQLCVPNNNNNNNNNNNKAGTGSKEIEEMILNLHNNKRAAHQAGKLTWNSDIAKFAQTWCDWMANTRKVNGKLEHSPKETDSSLPVAGRRALGYGENLAWNWAYPSYPKGSAGEANFIKISVEKSFNGWYNEKNNYDYSSGNSRNGRTIGHFTQVVWKGSRELGCGVSTANENKQHGGKQYTGIGFYLCCNYKQPGNYRGQYVQNVGRQSG